MTQDEHWRLTRNAADGAINKLVSDGISHHQNPALRKTSDSIYQTLLQQCSIDRQNLPPSFGVRPREHPSAAAALGTPPVAALASGGQAPRFSSEPFR
jgi:hypothetical protein